MNKIIHVITIVIILLSYGSINAQTNVGNVQLGISSTFGVAGAGPDFMNIGWTSIKYRSDVSSFDDSDKDEILSLNFAPKVGVFIADNFVLGLDFTLAGNFEKDGVDNDKVKQSVFGIGPFVRYYIPNTRVLPYFEIGNSFGVITVKYKEGNENRFETIFEENLFALGGGFGVAAPLGEKVSLDIFASYQSLTTKAKENNDHNFKTIYGTVGFRFGFTVFLGSNE